MKYWREGCKFDTGGRDNMYESIAGNIIVVAGE